MRRLPFILTGVIGLLSAPGLMGQTATPLFTLRVQQGTTVINIADGGLVTLPADAVGLSATATLTATYRGTSQVSINAFELTGSTDFSVSGVPELPFTLTPNQSLVVNIRFLASSSLRQSGQMAFAFNEGRFTGRFSLNLAGTAPEFAFSYIPLGGNSTLINSGGTIPFPLTAINATTSAVIVVLNRGTGTGTVNSISLSSAGEFQLVGVPLPGTSVEASKELRFAVTFTPKQLQTAKGAVTLEFIDRQVILNLEGSGSGPQFGYEAAQDSGFVGITPGQMLSIPDTNISEKGSIVVRVRNTGNADGKITTISIQGTGFTLSDSPFLPLTLTPGATATVTATFSPTQPGKFTGKLRIGDDSFDLSSTGLGAIVAYAYVVNDVSTTIVNNSSIVFPQVAIGTSASLRIEVSNTGTAPSSIGSILVTSTTVATPPIFAVAGAPSLPATVPAGGAVRFNVTFAPNAQGSATGTLRVDGVSFILSGTGAPPTTLPSYRFDGASGTVSSLQQPAVGLLLDAPYAFPLTGVLTLAFNSEVFSNDPSVQFATGGRTVNFTIAAGQTRAIFANNQNQMRMQTGTVAGFLILTPSFATDTGVNVTPPNPPSLTLTVPQAAPQLLSVQLSSKSANVITLLVSGYATSRSVTQMDMTFSPVTDENVQTTSLSVNVEPSFLAWYSSTQSQQFGSMFTMTVPLNVNGDINNVLTAAETVQSVTVTISNRLGRSSPITIQLK